MIARKAMTDRGLEPDFPTDAIQQLHGIQGAARETDRAIRDLRSLLWCSIDNDSSRDLDQLTVAEKLTAGRVKILVAIADVDAIVKPASPIDRHAKTNTTSVYTRSNHPCCRKDSRPTTSSTELGPALVIEMVVASDRPFKSSVYRARQQQSSHTAAWRPAGRQGQMPESWPRPKVWTNCGYKTRPLKS